MVHSIGADHVIDYTKEDFTQNRQKYDFILDVIGNRSVSDYKQVLNQKGNCVIVGFTSIGRLFQHMLFDPLFSKKGGKSIGLMGTSQPNKKDLIFLKDLISLVK